MVRALGVGEAGEGSVAGGACPGPPGPPSMGGTVAPCGPISCLTKVLYGKGATSCSCGGIAGQRRACISAGGQGHGVMGVRGTQGCPSPARLAVLLAVHTQTPGLARAP